MRKLIVLAMLLVLPACDSGGSTDTVRVDKNGTDVLYSKIHRRHGVTTFECIASVTGACHYALFAHACDASGPCNAEPFHTFGVPAGQHLIDTTLKPGVIACVGTGAGTATEHCPDHAIHR